MRKIMLLFVVPLILFTACGEEPMTEADAKACEQYSTTVEAAENDMISDEEMLADLEEAWNNAESERLQDLLDDLLIYFEEGEGDLQDTVNSIKSWCSLD